MFLIALQLFLPKRYAFAPIIIATLNLGNYEIYGQFTPVRLIVLAGIFRIIVSGNFPIGFRSNLDKTFVLFAIIALLSAPFHNPPHNPYTERIGLILNAVGVYFYGRGLLVGPEIFKRLAIILCISIVPLAVLTSYELSAGRNHYYPHLGGRGPSAMMRDGDFRARGPFAHPILAGTAGAVAFSFFIPFWNLYRKLALIGLAACIAVIISSNSSGPMAACLFSIGIVYSWRWRQYVPYAKWAILGSIVFLEIYMFRPFYYIMDSIDFTGGSTGWHRARLIEMAIEHLDEWWLFGTDYTRHWMPTGVSWSPDHTDLTNYYLHIGVIGGLPLTLCLVAMIWFSLKKLINLSFDLEENRHTHEAFTAWCLIGALIAHASSCISVSYFDQMYALLYMLIGLVANLNFQSFLTDKEISGEPQGSYSKASHSMGL